MAGASSSIEVGMILVGLCLLVVLLSVFVFSNQSLRLDEAQSLWQTSHSPLAMFSIVAQDVHVPFYHIILHYWQYFLGNDVRIARMLSLIFFLLIIPAIYFLGKLAYSRSVGLYAAVLVAVSPFLNWYGNEIRMYSLFTLLTILNQYFFIRIIKDKRVGAFEDVSGMIWLGYIATAVLGMFTHYFFLFALITQAAFFLSYRDLFPRISFRSFVMVAILLIVLLTPWAYYVYLLGSASNTQPLLEQPSSVDVFNTFSEFVFGFQNDHINTIILSLWPLLVLLIFMSLRRNQKVEPVTIFLFFSLLAPIVLAYAISVGVKAIYLTRYLILAVPSLYLLISWIFSMYPQRLSRTIKIGLFVAMIMGMTIEIVSASTPVKEDYRDASAYISQKASAEDIIVLSAPFTIYPFEYYYKGPAAVETLPIWNRDVVGAIPAYSSSTLPQQVSTLKDAHQNLWLLLSYDQGYENNIRIYFDTHYQRIDAKTFSPGMTLYGYKLRYDSQNLDQVLRDINSNINSTTKTTPPAGNTPPTGSSSSSSSSSL